MLASMMTETSSISHLTTTTPCLKSTRGSTTEVMPVPRCGFTSKRASRIGACPSRFGGRNDRICAFGTIWMRTSFGKSKKLSTKSTSTTTTRLTTPSSTNGAFTRWIMVNENLVIRLSPRRRPCTSSTSVSIPPLSPRNRCPPL